MLFLKILGWYFLKIKYPQNTHHEKTIYHLKYHKLWLVLSINKVLAYELVKFILVFECNCKTNFDFNM